MNPQFFFFTNLLCVFLMLLVTGFFLRFRASFPFGVVIGFWGLLYFICIVLTPEIPLNPVSVIYVFLALLTWSLGFILLAGKHKVALCSTFIPNSVIERVSLACILLSLLLSTLILRSYGISLNQISSSTIIQFAIMRVEGSNNSSYLYSFLYLICLLPGFGLSFVRKVSARVLVLAALPALSVIVLLSSKLILFYFASVAVVAIAVRERSKIFFTSRVLYQIIFLLALAASIILFSFTLREGYEDILDPMQRSRLGYLLRGYFLGPIFGFSEYIDRIPQYNLISGSSEIQQYSNRYTLGVFTFPIFLPSDTVDIMYPGSVRHNDYIATNLYTGFRPLIQDFGIIGSLLLMFLQGSLGGILRRLDLGGNTALKTCLLVGLISMPLISFIMSPFSSRFLISVTFFACFFYFFIVGIWRIKIR